jgi:hypothetical protein
VGRAELLSAAFSLVAFLVYSKSIGRSGKTGTVTCAYTNLWENHYIIYLYYFPWEFGWKSSNINLPWRTFSLAYFLALFQLFNVGWSGIAVTIVLVTCGMLCKEQGITVVGICLIYDLCVVNKVRLIPKVYTSHLVVFQSRHHHYPPPEIETLLLTIRNSVYPDGCWRSSLLLSCNLFEQEI